MGAAHPNNAERQVGLPERIGRILAGRTVNLSKSKVRPNLINSELRRTTYADKELYDKGICIEDSR